MKKTVSILKFDGGFIMPIKVFPGPQGGAYIPSEIEHMIPEEDRDEVEVVIYEIKKVKTVKLGDLK